MLQVTESAVSALRAARDAQHVPESFGVRLFSQASNNGQAAVGLAFAEQPAEGDQVSEHGDTAIYVAPELATALAESMLDVKETPEGPQLALVPKPGD